jgi:two-component system LytT family response regulator
VIFCTAFDQYAIDAFELHAVDCLLKPVTRARLAKVKNHAALETNHLPSITAPLHVALFKPAG